MQPRWLIAGIDEAGRGPLAGPVTAACVVFKPEYYNSRINDSKKLSEKQREALYDEICNNALSYSVVSVGARRIDHLNILEASRLAMKLVAERVTAALKGQDIHFLLDGNMSIGSKYSHEAIVKGDQKVKVIGAASILAKVTRDRLMRILDQHIPGYGLAGHKGYPTKAHREIIQVLGPSKFHRQTFSGVKEHL